MRKSKVKKNLRLKSILEVSDCFDSKIEQKVVEQVLKDTGGDIDRTISILATLLEPSESPVDTIKSRFKVEIDDSICRDVLAINNYDIDKTVEDMEKIYNIKPQALSRNEIQEVSQPLSTLTVYPDTSATLTSELTNTLALGRTPPISLSHIPDNHSNTRLHSSQNCLDRSMQILYSNIFGDVIDELHNTSNGTVLEPFCSAIERDELSTPSPSQFLLKHSMREESCLKFRRPTKECAYEIDPRGIYTQFLDSNSTKPNLIDTPNFSSDSPWTQELNNGNAPSTSSQFSTGKPVEVGNDVFESNSSSAILSHGSYEYVPFCNITPQEAAFDVIREIFDEHTLASSAVVEALKKHNYDTEETINYFCSSESVLKIGNTSGYKGKPSFAEMLKKSGNDLYNLYDPGSMNRTTRRLNMNCRAPNLYDENMLISKTSASTVNLKSDSENAVKMLEIWQLTANREAQYMMAAFNRATMAASSGIRCGHRHIGLTVAGYVANEGHEAKKRYKYAKLKCGYYTFLAQNPMLGIAINDEETSLVYLGPIKCLGTQDYQTSSAKNETTTTKISERIDFHGLTLDQAMQVLKSTLAYYKSYLNQLPSIRKIRLCLVVGVGLHSQGRIAKIKNQFVSYLKNRGFTYVASPSQANIDVSIAKVA